MSIPQPWGGDQLYRPRDGWGNYNPSNYWVQPPQRIPPAPPFSAYVPPAETIAFGEAPRDQNSYRVPESRVTRQQTLPVPPLPTGTNIPQHPQRVSWNLNEYQALQADVAPKATPKLPGPNNQLSPQHNARPDWTLRDYAAYQQWLAPLLYIAPSAVVPLGDFVAFGELPRDWTVYQTPLVAKLTFPFIPPPGIPKAYTQVQSFPRDRDMTAERLVIDAPRPTYLAIPMVPFGETQTIGYDALDMTPYLIANQEFTIPPPRIPYIPPNIVPYIEPPGWTLRDYNPYQDVFSALATPPIPVFPKGLRPTFTVEALIRDIPRATLLVQNFILPPPPPKPRPTPQTLNEWQDWNAAQYQQIQDQFSAWASGLPVPSGFRCMAVTAGMYGGQYYYPGDVFDINFAADFSDSSVNYQFLAGETVYGWMVRVPQTTPLFAYEINQPGMPVPDPKRRFVM